MNDRIYCVILVDPDSCKLEKIGDLTFFQQQENIVSIQSATLLDW